MSRLTTFSPLGLTYVAAVSPSNWEIKVVDENFDTFEFEEADLVGITALTSSVNRAYEIARLYRVHKIKVIIGGIHASMVPDEALQYSDAVVVGEVEGIWKRVIDDFENNRLSPKYMGPRIDLARFNITPRRDLLDPNYLWNSVQTSRGCPFNCNFCSVSRYLGKTYRQRRVEDVLEELNGIKGDYVTFLDDNLIGYSLRNRGRAMDLFKGMIDRGLSKKWWMQTSINATDDEQVVKLAAQAGCMFVFIGFESIRNGTLMSMRKAVNLKIGVENYKKVVDTFHKHGIAVFGGFIIGNDHESPLYYKELAEFLIQSGIDVIQISILTPLAGTRLMQQLEKEERLVYQDFPKDWDKYRMSYVVYRPRGVDKDAIYIGNNYIKQRVYSFPTYQYRLLRSFYHLKTFSKFVVSYKLNRAFKKSWQNSHYYNKYPMKLNLTDS